MALVIAAVLIPSIAIIGLFHFGTLKRVEDLKPDLEEWARSQDRKPPPKIKLKGPVPGKRYWPVSPLSGLV